MSARRVSGKPAPEPAELTPFGERVAKAVAFAETTQTSAERKALIPKGYVSRLIYGTRGQMSINPRHMDALARVLGVSFEWLVLGTGPMVARADYHPIARKKEKPHAPAPVSAHRRAAGM